MVSDDVMIAVDPRKASTSSVVLDPVTKTVIETARFANSDEGYARLAGFARRWEDRRWAVEGCRGAGRSPTASSAVAPLRLGTCGRTMRCTRRR